MDENARTAIMELLVVELRRGWKQAVDAGAAPQDLRGELGRRRRLIEGDGPAEGWGTRTSA